MTPEQHLEKILTQAEFRIKVKYLRGQAEHNDNLWEHSILDLVDNAIDEAVDQLVYLLTLRDKIKDENTS